MIAQRPETTGFLFSTRHSALSTQHSALNTQHFALCIGFSTQLESPQMNPGAWVILVAIATVITRSQFTVNAL
ncbi:MAG: hypothetical protein RMY16_27520 [Nostoc sp. DedQUE12b]|nr:hypothetical protein [Nostoc sp. DedQUE12b]